MSGLVIGLGEVGKALFNVLRIAYEDTYDFDIKTQTVIPGQCGFDVMHICIPYSPNFVSIVKNYQALCKPKLTIIHSTVPIGTTSQISDAVHSPILGKHNNMEESIMSFVKWVGGSRAKDAYDYFIGAGIRCKMIETSEETEMLKLVCLAKYGKDIAFAGYVDSLCKHYKVPYNDVIEWDINYNMFVDSRLHRPLITPPEGEIGGHCVLSNTEILNQQHPNAMLVEIIKYRKEKYKAWGVCNIYPSAEIGEGVNIGTFTEIGPNVTIGDRVRIGMGCFIPEGVTIEDDAWIGPKCTMTNDKYPPTGKAHWLPTLIKKGARIGAGVTIICGIIIGEGALIGAGSVVTKNIPAGEQWCGVPARRMTKCI